MQGRPAAFNPHRQLTGSAKAQFGGAEQTIHHVVRGMHTVINELGCPTGTDDEQRRQFAAADAVMPGRGARTAEYIEVMRRLWAGGVAEFHGEHYTVPAGRAAPLPVQRPGPPVLLGGAVPRALQRVGRLADGWITSSRADLSRIGEGIEVIRAAAADAGRDPAALRFICRGVVRWGTPVTVPEGGGRVPLSGGFDDIRADTQWLAEQGVTEVFYDLNWDPLVGAPDVAPAGAAARAAEILEGLAPGR